MTKKASAKLDSVYEVERALLESKDSASAVSVIALMFLLLCALPETCCSVAVK